MKKSNLTSEDPIDRQMVAELAERDEIRAQYQRDLVETGGLRPATRERITAAIERLKFMTFAPPRATASKVEN